MRKKKKDLDEMEALEDLFDEDEDDYRDSRYAGMSDKEMKAAVRLEKKRDEFAHRYGEEYADYAMEAEKDRLSKKKRSMFARGLNFSILNKEIKGYGYKYSFRRFLLTMVIILAGIAGVAWYFKIKPMPYMVAIIAIGLASVPVVLVAQFRLLNSIDRFQQVTKYLEYMIFHFKATPKILHALKDTRKLVDGPLAATIDQATDYITHNSTDPNVYERAFAIIEKEYPNSRVKALHKALMTVEMESSTDYHEAIDNLYFDVRNWITRTYRYQLDLKYKRANITIAMIFAMIIMTVFVNIYKTNETLGGFTTNPVYQIATTAFFIAMIVTYTLVQTKLTGGWLVDDMSDYTNLSALAAYHKLENWDSKKEKSMAIIVGVIFAALNVVIAFLFKAPFFYVIGGLMFLFFLAKPSLDYKAKKKAVTRAVDKEFPIWLRDVSLNMSNSVVYQAIQKSYDNSSVIMKPFISRFLKEVREDPVSIRPYDNFMEGFDLPDVALAMKSLYAIQSVSGDDAKRMLSDLIIRNQELLDHSEQTRNEDALAGIQFLSNIPMILMAGKMLIDMVLMMTAVMGSMGSGVSV